MCAITRTSASPFWDCSGTSDVTIVLALRLTKFGVILRNQKLVDRQGFFAMQHQLEPVRVKAATGEIVGAEVEIAQNASESTNFEGLASVDRYDCWDSLMHHNVMASADSDDGKPLRLEKTNHFRSCQAR